MVLALAGDSTTTRFFQAAGKLEFEQGEANDGRRELAPAKEFVNRDRARPEQALDLREGRFQAFKRRFGQAFAGLRSVLAGPGKPRNLSAQRGEDVLGRLGQRGALAQQLVAAARPGIERRAGHREDLAALFSGQARGDQRSGARRRLDHQHALAESRDDAVAAGKVACLGLEAERHLREDQARFANRLVECLVLRRVDHVEAAGQHRDGAAG